MYLRARLALLSLLVLMVSGQKSKARKERPQGRTLGLLTPLLLGGGGPLFDVPLPAGPPIRPGGGSSAAAGGGTQSDSYYGGGYPGYGYRPNYGYGYPNYGTNYFYGYPGFGYGYGQNNYRPSYNNYAGYQRPQPSYGYRPTYSSIGTGASGGYPSYSGSAGISSAPITSGAGAVSGGGSPQLSTAQQAQLAGILGQALGNSLRPLLANGGGAAGATGATGAAVNPQALSGLLSLLG
ncbi:probable peroxisomal membrane protein PEX13 [Drosophila erecta]|uniref:Uncharacterized protein n=1 Tax=Drosophila erecta TaxID=7220 RepID=B3NSL9_DROER|nr:probable peroxisomal membrane protein PEX13 [Drosophila erecta]EDV56521.1 uncharacterized protein Dere_GG20174 [Drosophila erecta]